MQMGLLRRDNGEEDSVSVKLRTNLFRPRHATSHPSSSFLPSLHLAKAAFLACQKFCLGREEGREGGREGGPMSSCSSHFYEVHCKLWQRARDATCVQ